MTKVTQEELLKENLLPESLKFSPFTMVSRWFNEAVQLAWQPNPNNMVISTVKESTQKKTTQASVLDNEALEEKIYVPDSRVVLCKDMDIEKGYLVFFTNYQSAKGEQLKTNPKASALFHWDNLGRQIRISGNIVRSPVMESEHYYNSRHPLSRLGAWASDQSQAIESREALLERLEEEKERFKPAGENIPRPAHWGGYRLWATKVELWISHPGRIHDRAVWTRDIKDQQADEFHFSKWTATRLQP